MPYYCDADILKVFVCKVPYHHADIGKVPCHDADFVGKVSYHDADI